MQKCIAVHNWTVYRVASIYEDKLELVMQGNVLSPYDNGKFGDVIENGDKNKGTDFHSLNAKAMNVSRGKSKGIFYGVSLTT
jgi:hypothetical protein